MAEGGTFRGLLPSKLQPRVVAFQMSRYQDLYKLMVNGRVVGRYDERNDEWRIRPPFQLFVDQSRLPRPERRDQPMPRHSANGEDMAPD